MHSVLTQDFRDFEIVVIDDCSTDDTANVVSSFNDERIRYIRNSENVGSIAGDRAILREFVYSIMRGRYFVYLCDDDYWCDTTLLRRQVEAFEKYPDVSFVMGNQLSQVLENGEGSVALSPEDVEQRAKNQIGYTPRLFPKEFMTSSEFLALSATHPTGTNIITGATLYLRDIFIHSGALATKIGSQWQAGYEIKIGPACYGNIVYFDEPAVVTEIRPSNASFRRTQLEHYRDAVFSIELSFSKPLSDHNLKHRMAELKARKRETIRHLSRTFLNNSYVIYQGKPLTLCGAENLAVPVRTTHVANTFLKHGIVPMPRDFASCARVEALALLRRN